MDRVVEVTFPGGQGIKAHIGGKVIESDRPKELGGGGAAPAPFTLFLASIATCAGMYALGFCESRDLATEGMSLLMICEKDEEADLFGKMRLKLKLPKGFPEKYKRPILRTMDQCNVKKQIVNPPEFILETD